MDQFEKQSITAYNTSYLTSILRFTPQNTFGRKADVISRVDYHWRFSTKFQRHWSKIANGRGGNNPSDGRVPCEDD